MALYIEAPEPYVKKPGDFPSLFIGGGISGTKDWQTPFIKRLMPYDLTLVNPRRANFPMNDPSAAKVQIAWEHTQLHDADAVSFYFPPETLCPITLFELGRYSTAALKKPLFVAVHPDYARRQDVELQLALERPDVKICYDIDALANQVIAWLEDAKRK